VTEFGPGEFELVGMVFNGVPVSQLAAAFYSGVEWEQLTVQEKGAFLEYQRWKYRKWRDGK